MNFHTIPHYIVWLQQDILKIIILLNSAAELPTKFGKKQRHTLW